MLFIPMPFHLSILKQIKLTDFMQAVMLLSKISNKKNLAGDPIERERLHDVIDCLLSFMV